MLGWRHTSPKPEASSRRSGCWTEHDHEAQAINKSEIRKLYLEKRRSLTPAEHGALSSSIAERFFAEIDLSSVRALHCFISMKHAGEVETPQILSRIWNEHPGIRTYAPRVNQETGEIDALEFSHDTHLVESRWRIPEPPGTETANPGIFDVVVVPLLCFDSLGFRVGYGRGYYDRFLGRCRPDCIKAGVSFFPPIDRIDNVHDGDMPLDLCLTPDATYRWKQPGTSYPEITRSPS